MPNSSSKSVARKGSSQGAIPKISRKRQRITSDEDYVPKEEEREKRRTSRARSEGGTSRQTRPKSRSKTEKSKQRESQSHDMDSSSRSELRRCHQRLRKMEAEKRKVDEKLEKKRKLLAAEQEKNGRVNRDLEKAGRDLDKVRREKNRLKVANEKLVKEVADQSLAAMNDVNRWRQKVEGLKKKLNKGELEKVKLESKISTLSCLGASGSDPGAGPSTSGTGGLFQDMMDNFRELAEGQLQCAVCNEVFVEAVSINCGHTFCSYCIGQWKKKKNNCPVCRADISQQTEVKVLDEYVDKVYDQFVSDAGKHQRTQLKEEREKAKTEAVAKAQQRTVERRERAQARRNNGLELVNIVLNRAGRSRNVGPGRGDDEESSLDSDVTLELHLSDGQSNFDTDDSRDPSPDRVNLQSLLYDDDHINSDTDSSDDSFRASNSDNNDSDTDSIPCPDTETDQSDSSSDSSRSNTSSSDSSSDSDSDF